MGRSFDTQSLVDLPSLNAGSAVTLGQKLLAVAAREAKEKRLPASLAKARSRIAATHEERLQEPLANHEPTSRAKGGGSAPAPSETPISSKPPTAA